jgi:dTDP-4-dehydrorhamnose 3,5-epimerase
MSNRFVIEPSALPGLNTVTRLPIADSRGFFERMYCTESLTAEGFSKPVVQINRTLTQKKATVRGLHFQRLPYAETKMVSCLRGEVFDVAVDLRANSLTYLKWHGEILTSDNFKSLIIPEGFAHGFQTLVDNCEMLYFHTEFFHPESEGGISAIDPAIGIQWPLEICEISKRDLSFSLISNRNKGIEL